MEVCAHELKCPNRIVLKVVFPFLHYLVRSDAEIGFVLAILISWAVRAVSIFVCRLARPRTVRASCCQEYAAGFPAAGSLCRVICGPS